jgi:hypothetical protein
MMVRVFALVLMIASLGFYDSLYAQDKLIDPIMRHLLDSLNLRATAIRQELPRLTEQRNAVFYFKKRELDITLFLIEYHNYLFDEDLDQAKKLVDAKLSLAKKINDTYVIEYYSDLSRKLTIEFGKHQARYQKLFEKEKNFKKELYLFLDEGSEYSLLRAKRMIELAIKYATDKKMENVWAYLNNYNRLTEALIFDFHSEYDLKKMTSSESVFQKVFKPMVESDSVELIKKAGELVKYCNTYAANSLSILDTSYFEQQMKVVKSSINDYEERKGSNLNLANLAGQTVIMRLDTLNAEGIYKWHDKIVVVGTLKFTATFDNVKKGEAILSADKKLIQYIRVNKIAKIGNEVNVGSTSLIPFTIDEKKTDFFFNPKKKEFQYIICYSKVENKYFTKGISKFLPPMQFREEINTAMK